MARPQNGVNGSLPQQNYGFIPNMFNINQQVQRNHNQNVYGYPEMQQVVPSHFVPQGYPSALNHNVTNNIRPVSPIVGQPHFTLIPYPYNQTPQYNQYAQYTPNYIQPQHYGYPQETQAPMQLNFPPTTRKFQPLQVVDPTNNTDLDLSKFQTQTASVKGSMDILKSDKSESLIIESKEENPQKISEIAEVMEIIQVDKKEETMKINEKIIIEMEDNGKKDKIKESEKIESCEIKEENAYDKMVSELVEKNLKFIHEAVKKNANKVTTSESPEKKVVEKGNSDKEMEKREYIHKVVFIEQLSSTMDTDNEKCDEEINDEYKQEDKEDITKIDSSLEKVNEEECSNTRGSKTEEQSLSIVLEKNPVNYFLQINKKESDETTLRRKMIYDREYLIRIKSNSQSQRKPLNLPSTGDFSEEIIYSESQNISCNKPEASQAALNNNDKYNKKQVSKFPTNINRKYTKFQPKLINLDLNENQVFHRLKSSYLPPQLRDKDIDAFKQLKRNIKCNLNKITPQNFQDCLSEISKLNIKEEDEMACLISEIFIKAVQEEAYSVTYAQFCNKLACSYAGAHSFKSQLLKKCQDMFQTPIQEQLDSVRKEWMIKVDNESDCKMKSLYESDLEEQVKKAKDRYFGNIRFIGELFLHNLLAGKVILNCICELLKGKNDTDALLALCKLMETCGKQIDERNKDKMNDFILNMDELSKSEVLETRIRFKLKDIVDMRIRGWTLRHIQQEKKINPKTIEEQKEEAAAEAAVKLVASQTLNKRSHHTVQNHSVRRQVSVSQKSFPVKNLTFSSLSVDDKFVLGPASSNWTAGSGSKQKLRDSEVLNSLPQKYDSRSPDNSPQLKIKNKYRTLESSTEGSGADSRSSTPPTTHPRNVTKQSVIKKENEFSLMSDDEIASLIFNHLLLTGEFKFDSWDEIHNVRPIIEKWIDDMMEKDASCRRIIGDSFTKLIQDKVITLEQLVDGSQSLMSCVDDLICDIPKLWEFFAQFLERFICDKNSNISFFNDIFKILLPNLNVAHCLSMTLHAASSRLGHTIVGQVFHKSALKWEKIVPNNWEKFVKSNDLNFTISGGAILSSVGGHPLQSITNNLETMLSNNSSNEEIFDFLEKHIDKPTWKSKECIRTVTGCILKAIKGKSAIIVRAYLNQKSEIIKQLSQNKLENEIEVLKSILQVADELDKEILTIVFDVIVTGKVVSNEAFNHYLKDHLFKSQPNFDLTYQIISQLYIPKNDR